MTAAFIPADTAALAGLPPHVGAGKAAAIAVSFLLALFSSAELAAQAKIGGGEPPASCVVVEIDGYRSGHLECVSQKLTDAARTAQRDAGAQAAVKVPEAGSPDVEVGVASRSGASLRMGNALGHSVHPQRPGVSIPPPNLGPRQ